MRKLNKKELKLKGFLDIKNVSIILLVVIIILLLIIIANVESKPEVTTFNFKYKNETGESMCQREYFYGENEEFIVNICDYKMYISNFSDNEYTLLNINDPVYLYSYYTLEDTFFYVITKDKKVYEISASDISEKNYELKKLDLENIINIKTFYLGLEKEYAYSTYLYAIDEEGKMHLIR